MLADYRDKTGDETPAVVVSTASPFKFCSSVLGALGETELAPGTQILTQLADKTGKPVPAPLGALAGKSVRFDGAAEKSAMESVVREFLK